MPWLASPPSSAGANAGAAAGVAQLLPLSLVKRQSAMASAVEKKPLPPIKATGLSGTSEAAPAESRLMMAGAAQAAAVPTAKPPMAFRREIVNCAASRLFSTIRQVYATMQPGGRPVADPLPGEDPVMVRTDVLA